MACESDVNSDCVLWQGATSAQGYGVRSVRTARGWQTKLVHRLAYAAAYGPIPHRHDIHHRCGVRRCHNPEHLEALPHAAHARLHSDHLPPAPRKVSDEQVAEIIQLFDGGMKQPEIARRFGLARSTVSNFCTGRNRPGVTGDRSHSHTGPRQKLTDEQIHEIRGLCAAGWVRGDIAAAYGISRSHLSNIEHGKARRGALASTALSPNPV